MAHAGRAALAVGQDDRYARTQQRLETLSVACQGNITGHEFLFGWRRVGSMGYMAV
jgi:hypothetical protein